jgi:sugar/nucleoside kinase (ribokinase family)
MLSAPEHENIDYLAIGYLTRDIRADGDMLGGSAAYAAKTAAAFGLKVGILTSWGDDIDIEALDGIHIVNSSFGPSTSFENSSQGKKRVQKVHQLAPSIEIQHLPTAWQRAKIVHFAPVIGEISPRSIKHFPEASIGITPQGWLRRLENDGHVMQADWPESNFVLQHAMAAVISQEDIGQDEKSLDSLAASSAILALTNGAETSRIFHQGSEILLPPIATQEVDASGAGDIFAAAFFIGLHFGDSVAEAGRVANEMAARSVGRIGMQSTPSMDEIYDLMPRAIQ